MSMTKEKFVESEHPRDSNNQDFIDADSPQALLERRTPVTPHFDSSGYLKNPTLPPHAIEAPKNVLSQVDECKAWDALEVSEEEAEKLNHEAGLFAEETFTEADFDEFISKTDGAYRAFARRWKAKFMAEKEAKAKEEAKMRHALGMDSNKA